MSLTVSDAPNSAYSSSLPLMLRFRDSRSILKVHLECQRRLHDKALG